MRKSRKKSATKASRKEKGKGRDKLIFRSSPLMDQKKKRMTDENDEEVTAEVDRLTPLTQVRVQT